MRTAKIRKNKKEQKQQIMEEEYSVKKMAIIIVIIIIVFALFYLITTLVVKPAKEEKIETPVVFDSSKILLSGLLNRDEDEYYVLAVKKVSDISSYQEIDYMTIYNKFITQYKNTKDSLKFYYVDLDNGLNSNYISDKTNISSNLEELKLSEDVLFKIKKGKIESSYIGHEKIIEALKDLIPEES